MTGASSAWQSVVLKVMRRWTKPCRAPQVAAVRFVQDPAFIPHVGEGTSAGANYAVDCVLDAIRSKTAASAIFHGVAISQPQIARLKQQDVTVVLSPRSNFQLYGATAPVATLHASGAMKPLKV